MLGLIALWIGALLAAAGTPADSQTHRVRLRKAIAVPTELRWAQDVRWDGSDALISAGREGVFRLPITLDGTSKNRKISKLDLAFSFSSRLAFHKRDLVVASPFAALVWKSSGSTYREMPFAVIVDIDVNNGNVAILGSNRSPSGEWAPEGGIAWFGSLSENLGDLRPLFYAKEGKGADSMARCHFMELGAVRFMTDGTVILIPGVEPGIFQYSPSGRLLRTWQTSALKIQDTCDTGDRWEELARDPIARWDWLKKRRTVEDILPLANGQPALVIRNAYGTSVTWDLVILNHQSPAKTIRLPIESRSHLTHLRGDVRGNKILMLALEYGLLKEPPASPPRLYLLEIDQ